VISTYLICIAVHCIIYINCLGLFAWCTKIVLPWRVKS